MSDSVEVEGTLTAFGAEPQGAKATVLEQSPGRRLARALAALGVFWALALAGLFIPVAHLILVPAFIIAGIVAAAMKGREDRLLLRVRGVCPRCGVKQEFAVGGRFRRERNFDCPHCHNALRLLCDGAAAGARSPHG
jgi:hypothetical protein